MLNNNNIDIVTKIDILFVRARWGQRYLLCLIGSGCSSKWVLRMVERSFVSFIWTLLLYEENSPL